MAVVTAQGWAFRELTQQAFFHNIPMAIANGLDFATYVELNAASRNPSTRFFPLHLEGSPSRNGL